MIDALAEVPQMSGHLEGKVMSKLIDPPCSGRGRDHKSALAKVCEMLGNLDLRQEKDGLQFLDAERPLAEKRNDSQPVRMTKALVNSRQAHGATVCSYQHILQHECIELLVWAPNLGALVARKVYQWLRGRLWQTRARIIVDRCDVAGSSLHRTS